MTYQELIEMTTKTKSVLREALEEYSKPNVVGSFKLAIRLHIVPNVDDLTRYRYEYKYECFSDIGMYNVSNPHQKFSINLKDIDEFCNFVKLKMMMDSFEVAFDKSWFDYEYSIVNLKIKVIPLNQYDN